jgi:hypothetical protein
MDVQIFRFFLISKIPSYFFPSVMSFIVFNLLPILTTGIIHFTDPSLANKTRNAAMINVTAGFVILYILFVLEVKDRHIGVYRRCNELVVIIVVVNHYVVVGLMINVWMMIRHSQQIVVATAHALE